MAGSRLALSGVGVPQVVVTISSWSESVESNLHHRDRAGLLRGEDERFRVGDAVDDGDAAPDGSVELQRSINTPRQFRREHQLASHTRWRRCPRERRCLAAKSPTPGTETLASPGQLRYSRARYVVCAMPYSANFRSR